MSYLCIPYINIKNANMVSSNYALTCAQPMALTLFAHALSLKLGCNVMGRVGVVYHDVLPLGEQGPLFLPHQRKGASFIDKDDYPGKTLALSMQPVAGMHLKVTLFIEIEGRIRSDVSTALSSMRIAGGTIINFGEPLIVDSINESPISNGHWLIERTDLVDPQDPVHSLVDALSQRARDWLSPAALGYALTTQIKARSGVRPLSDGQIPEHAFCEPLLGLTQYVGVRTWQELGADLPMWESSWLQDDVFVSRNSFTDFLTLDALLEEKKSNSRALA